MAKSIRSKWKRKCRAIKRERYGKKELERLKKTLGIDDVKKTDVDMVEISAVANVVDKTALGGQEIKEEAHQMETDAKKRVFNPKTLKDQHGSYPVWLHPRKIIKKKKSKKGNKKRKH